MDIVNNKRQRAIENRRNRFPSNFPIPYLLALNWYFCQTLIVEMSLTVVGMYYVHTVHKIIRTR